MTNVSRSGGFGSPTSRRTNRSIEDLTRLVAQLEAQIAALEARIKALEGGA